MNFKSVIIVLLIRISIEDLQYLDGYNDSCLGCGCRSRLLKVTFSSEFSRVPQVFAFPLIRGIDNSGSTLSYELSIVSITTKQFGVQLSTKNCWITDLTFKWVAIDDQRIEVLYQFTALPEAKNLTHNNLNVEKGIVILTSFSGSTLLNFTLSLGVFTTTTVEVIVESSGLDEIGYIVILGPSEFFSIGNQLNWLPKDANDQSAFINNFTNVQNKVQLFYIQSFTFTVGGALKVQLIPQFAPEKCSYQLSSWLNYQVYFSKLIHQCTLINFSMNTLQAFSLKKIMVANYFYVQTPNIIANTLELTMVELNLTYSQAIDSKMTIPFNYQRISLIFKVLCLQKYKISGRYFQCNTCLMKYTQDYCTLKENIIRIETYFQQQTNAYSQLSITIESNYRSLRNKLSKLGDKFKFIKQFQIKLLNRFQLPNLTQFLEVLIFNYEFNFFVSIQHSQRLHSLYFVIKAINNVQSNLAHLRKFLFVNTYLLH